MIPIWLVAVLNIITMLLMISMTVQVLVAEARESRHNGSMSEEA